MALDATVGRLATMTEPDGEYVEYHGAQNTQRYIHEFRVRVATLNRALQEAGLETHEEPDFSTLGPDPKCLNTVRLGFYSSAQDWYLDSLIAHLVVHRQVPRTIEDLRPDTQKIFSQSHATFFPKEAAKAPKQGWFSHPYFVDCGFSSVYVPQDFTVVIQLEKVDNDISVIGSSVALEKACKYVLAACGYFDPWDDPVMDIREGKIVELEGLEPLEETPEWLVNTLTLVERLQRIAQRSLKTRSIVTFS